MCGKFSGKNRIFALYFYFVSGSSSSQATKKQPNNNLTPCQKNKQTKQTNKKSPRKKSSEGHGHCELGKI